MGVVPPLVGLPTLCTPGQEEISIGREKQMLAPGQVSLVIHPQ